MSNVALLKRDRGDGMVEYMRLVSQNIAIAGQ